MSYKQINQEKFITDTFNKIHSDITQFLIDTNYSNAPSIKLRNELEEYNSKMKIFKNPTETNKTKIDEYNYSKKPNFPSLILNVKSPNLFVPNALVFTPKTKPKNIFKGFLDMTSIKENQKKMKSLKYKKKKHLNINININNQYNDKYYKYNNDSKNKKFFHQRIRDKYDNTIINNEDISRGIYDMNVKKLIPRGADVSPSMNIWGNPFKIIGKEVKNIYKKNSSKEDIALCEKNRLIPNKYTINEFYQKNLKKNFSKNINETYSDIDFNKNKFFVTTDNFYFQNLKQLLNTKNKTMYNINKANTFYDLVNQQKIYINDINNINNDNKFSKTFYKSNYKNIFLKFADYIKHIDMTNNIIIKYIDFELIKDSDFVKFYQENQKNWTKIENILSNYKLIFEKLNMNKAFIDSNKILKLIEYYRGKMNCITNKDLIICLNKNDLIEKGYDTNNENIMYTQIKLAFIIKIQKSYRKHLSYKKYLNLKFFIIYLSKIQKYIKGRHIRKKLNQELDLYKQQMHKKYIELFNKFKEDYSDIIKSQRIEIHINSLSYKGKYNNCLTDKYPMKEALQLSRLIKLSEPNLEIIYIIPYELPEEIISYYFSILDKLGIKDADKRVTFIIPEATNYLPLNYSLSKLLFFSKKALEKIKNLVKNKKSYIIPGIIGDIEEQLSITLNIPMLMSPKNNIDLILNKSGIKNLFEKNNIPFPISAWDIITPDEFYSSLVHLISSYPNINIWIFKTNFDNNATGIAYLNTDKIDIINNFRKKLKINKTPEEEKIIKKKFLYELKNVLGKYVSFAYPNLYKNWNEYLSHFLSYRGVIECCPTKGLGGIMGKPCIPMYIEPNGIINILPSYEKINVDNFKNVLNTSPQKCLEDNEMINLGKKLGNILYEQGIIGYATIECITFHNGEEVLYWCVDIKYGFTQTICDIQFCYFLYLQSLKSNLNNISNNNDDGVTSTNNKNMDETESFNYNIQFKDSKDNYSMQISPLLNNSKKENSEQLLTNSMIFSLPYVTSGFIYAIKLQTLLNIYKVGNLIFNMKKKEGIILNLCDNFECGIFGICGVVSFDDYESIIPELKLWRLIDTSVNVIKEAIFSIQKSKVINVINSFYNNKERSDKIEFQYILNKVKKKLKEKEEQQKKEEEKRKKLAESLFV